MPDNGRTVRNTSTDPLTPLILLADAMSSAGRGGSHAIEEMEAAGQRELVNSDVIPTSGSEDLAQFGATLGDRVDGDPIFRHVTLPDGWKREGSDHSMWSYIVDALGRRRVAVFYKAAFYDRDAFCRVQSLLSYLTEVSRGDAKLVLDDVWATPETVTAAVAEGVERERKEAAVCRQYGMAEAEARHDESAEKVQALLNLLPAPTPESGETA